MKSPLGEALKTLNRNKEKPRIAVCSCGSPLVWTFAFAYKEYLCLECGRGYGAMGVNEVELTKELKYKQTLYKKIWKVIYGGNYFLPRSNYQKRGCSKCENDNHNNHLTETEKIKDKIAVDLFSRIIKRG